MPDVPMYTIAQPANFAELIRDKVRDTILGAIPQEQIDALIAAEWTACVDGVPAGKNQWGTVCTPAQPPKLKAMIENEIAAQLRPMVQAAVEKGLTERWDNGQREIAGEMVDKLRPHLADALFGAMASRIAGELRDAVRNGRF